MKKEADYGAKLTIRGIKNKHIKKAFFSLIALVFISCSNKQQELEYLLSNGSIQYWNVERESNKEDKIYGLTYGFIKIGKVKEYAYRKDLNKRYFRGCDSIYRKDCLKWEINEDTIIYKAYSIKEKITKISKNRDTIYTISFYNGYLVNAPKTEKVKYTRVYGKLNVQN